MRPTISHEVQLLKSVFLVQSSNFMEYKNSLIITKKKLINANQLILDDFPIKITKLLEKVNIEFLKVKFNEKQIASDCELSLFKSPTF